MKQYKVKVFDLRGLNGLSDLQIETTSEFYVSYVSNSNHLNEQLVELARAGKSGTPAYAELTRRLGFEFNGMRLHELYFENLSPVVELGCATIRHCTLGSTTRVRALSGSWQRDFAAVAKMRGVGWAVLRPGPGKTGPFSATTGSCFTSMAIRRGFDPCWSWTSGSTPSWSIIDRWSANTTSTPFFADVDWSEVERRSGCSEDDVGTAIHD